MLRYILVLVACLLSSVLAAETRGISIQDAQGKAIGGYKASYALLVGVGDYTNGWPDLASVGPELTRVAQLLESKGFEVRLVLDPGSDQLQSAFEKFVDDYGYDSGNRLLVYYSGHGYTRDNGNKGYLVPADAPIPTDDERGFLRKAYAMTDLIAIARKMEATHALFLFDSCFSGTIFKTRALPETPQVISQLTSKPVRQFITAGDAGEEVPARSVFTPAFIDSLEYGLGDLNGDGFVTGTELGLYLQSTVPQHARQTPQFGKIDDYELSRGDFVFGVKKLVVAPVSTASPTDRVAAMPDLSGRWSGRYYYSLGDSRPPVPFIVDLYDVGGTLQGRISELNTFGEASATSLYADLSGRYEGDHVQFLKQYDGTGGQTHEIRYDGQLDADFVTIKGTWRLPGLSGQFELYRR